MLGIEDYGSDNDSGDEQQKPSSSSKTASKTSLPPRAKKSTFSLPSPTHSSTASTQSIPPPKSKRAPKKLVIDLPSLPSDGTAESDDERPAPKKARLTTGAGTSSLLSMLPAPKQKAPVAPTQERVLGSGQGPGLVFRQSRPKETAEPVDENDENAEHSETEVRDSVTASREDVAGPPSSSSVLFLPPSMAKGRANISVEEGRPSARPPARVSAAPAVDFFSINDSSSSLSASSSSAAAAPAASTATSTSAIPALSSAPKLDDFTPPEPTPTDPYPGYYLLPSGAWAAYEPEYYQKFYIKWQKQYDAHVRALEKGNTKGFEAAATADAQEVDLASEMEKAKKEIKEREEKKGLTKAKNAVEQPRMNVKGAKLGSVARSRHQLTTLLTEAYMNREALEDRIAEGRRNRKEAGNKYGF